MNKISSGIRERLRRHFHPADDSHEPTLENLQGLIFDICSLLNGVYFIVDGLDEAEADNRIAVLQFLEHVPLHVKIFVAGQPEINVATLFKGSWAVTIDITEHDVKEDICKFIDIMLGQDKAANGVLSSYGLCFTDHLKAALASKAQGM